MYIGPGRIKKELEECQKGVEVSGVTAQSRNGALNALVGTIRGPPGTPYENGVFSLDIDIPSTYVVDA